MYTNQTAVMEDGDADRDVPQCTIQSAREQRGFFTTPGRELEDLLYPVTPEQFVDRYWTREPLYIKGPATKFVELFDSAAFHAAARGAGAIHVELKGGERLRKPHPDDIDLYLQLGSTICLTDIGHTNERLQAVVDAVKHQLHFSGVLDVRSYLSSDGCGYATHADARVATTLQISGVKRWRFARSAAIDFPLHSIVPTLGGYRLYGEGKPFSWEHFEQPDEGSFVEVVLEPGDLLCLPAGTWHAAEARGSSLALNMAFNSLSFDHFIMSALRQRLLALPEWRRPIPLLPGPQMDGSVPEPVATFFESRLREMKESIDELCANGPEMAHAWRQRVYARAELANETANVVPVDEDPILPSDAFVRKPFVGYGWSIDEEWRTTLTIYEGTRTRSVGLPSRSESYVRKLMTTSSFRAEESMCWGDDSSLYEWSTVEAILRALLECGVLERKNNSGLGN